MRISGSGGSGGNKSTEEQGQNKDTSSFQKTPKTPHSLSPSETINT
jgi:hypothetical protein